MKTKNKIMLGCLTAAILGIGVAAASTIAVKLKPAEQLSLNAVEKLPEANEGGLVPGNAIYIGLVNGSDTSDWVNPEYEYRAYFFIDSDTYAWSEPFTKVNDDYEIYGDNDYWRITNIWECVVPESPNGSNWAACLIAVCSDREEISWDRVINQTVDVRFSGTQNVVKVDYQDVNNEGKVNGIADTIAAENRIASWAGNLGFWGSNNTICKEDGSTDVDELKAAWDAAGEKFSTFGADVKAYFSNVESAPEESDSHNCQKFAGKYDYLFRKYGATAGFEDWGHRGYLVA